MNRFEMIDKLRERANIGYEEADQLLEQTNGNLMEALIILEKQGRIRQPQSFQGEQRSQLNEVKKERKKGAFSRAIHKAGSFLSNTSFHIARNGKEILLMPSWAFALLMFFFWQTLLPIMVISLFFDMQYRFDGSGNGESANEVKAANEVLVKAESFADGFNDSLKEEKEAV